MFIKSVSSTTLDLKSIRVGGIKNTLQVPQTTAVTNVATPLNLTSSPKASQSSNGKPKRRKKMEPMKSMNNIKNFFECVVEMLRKNDN
jgi:hypothetical protein